MNRKQRRNKASTNGHQSIITSADDIPLARPDSTARDAKPNTKTLFEIAAERQAKLTGRPGGRPIDPKNIVQVKIGEDGQVQPDPNAPSATTFPTTSDDDARLETPWLDTILLAVSLSAVHFTLDVLTVHQYAQELEFPPIFARSIFTAFPTLTVVIALFHGLLFPQSFGQITPPNVRQGIFRLRQIIYILVANVAGCYLIALTNDKGYYAVMKDAPSVGTIWVWAVLELGLLGALAGVAGPAMYAWWNEYGIF